MIVKSLKKNNNGTYLVLFEKEKSICICEETVLRYRLFEDNEIDDIIFEEIKKFDEYEKYKKMAAAYSYKYVKSSKEVVLYLENKGLDYEYCQKIVIDLVDSKIINDEIMAISIAGSLARKSNGPLMIKQKLLNRLFSSNIIKKALDSVSEDDYLAGYNKLLDKANNKYSKVDGTVKKYKIKELLYRHGYCE